MFGQIIGSAIGAGASLIAANKAANTQKDINSENIAQQREFAQNGIRWKVEDAQRAGIHPLYALGANTQSFNPIPIGDGGGGIIADMGQRLGQDIGRAIDSTRTRGERATAAAISLKQAELQTENMKLQNDILKADLASRVSRMAGNPPMPAGGSRVSSNPLSGQGNLPLPVDRENQVQVKGDPTNAARLAAPTASIIFSRNDDGSLTPQMANSQGQLRDDMDITDPSVIEWWVRNRILPVASGISAPSKKVHPLPSGYEWTWNPFKQAFYPAKKGDYWRGVYERRQQMLNGTYKQ